MDLRTIRGRLADEHLDEQLHAIAVVIWNGCEFATANTASVSCWRAWCKDAARSQAGMHARTAAVAAHLITLTVIAARLVASNALRRVHSSYRMQPMAQMSVFLS